MSDTAKIRAGKTGPGAGHADYMSHEYIDDDYAIADMPVGVRTDERRLHVQAYNYWSSLLGDKNYPSIRDIDLDALPDFKTQSILLNFKNGEDNPSIEYVGAALADQCGISRTISSISEVPFPSILSHIGNHYMQIIASEAPVGFEAEFANSDKKKILYRSILLPLSSDGETIDYICGVINWKELANHAVTRQIMHEAERAADSGSGEVRKRLGWTSADGTMPPDIIGEILTYYCPQPNA